MLNQIKGKSLSKTVVRANVPWARIPLPPPVF